jgi:hypothetical protein
VGSFYIFINIINILKMEDFIMFTNLVAAFKKEYDKLIVYCVIPCDITKKQPDDYMKRKCAIFKFDYVKRYNQTSSITKNNIKLDSYEQIFLNKVSKDKTYYTQEILDFIKDKVIEDKYQFIMLDSKHSYLATDSFLYEMIDEFEHTHDMIDEDVQDKELSQNAIEKYKNGELIPVVSFTNRLTFYFTPPVNDMITY